MTRIQKAQNAILFLLFTVAAVYVLYNWYFPVRFLYLLDELFVFPERLWFKDQWDWLQHLLFFSQQRIVFCGDFMLYRPGLFIWIWLQDILFRTDRLAQNYFLVGVCCVGMAAYYSVLYKRAGKFLAASAALYAITNLRGTTFYLWPHINGYLWGVALYALAGIYLVNNRMTTRRSVGVALTFFIGAIFHEFVGPALVVLICCEWFLWRSKKEVDQSNLRLSAMGGALVAYGLLVVIAFLVLRPPGLFSVGETDGVKFDADMLERLRSGLVTMSSWWLEEFLPFPQVSAPLDWVRFIAGGLLVGLILVKAIRFRRVAENRQLIVALVPVFIIFFGLAVGRFLTRGSMGAHYYSMIQYFMVMAAIIAIPATWRQWPRIAIGLLMLASSVRLAYYTNMNASRGYDPSMRVIEDVVRFLGRHPERCFAGVFDPYLRTFINESTNIALQEHNCDWRAGTPAYFYVTEDGTALEYRPPGDPPQVKATQHTLPAPQSSDMLAKYLKSLTYNIQEARQDLRHDGLIDLRLSSAPVSAREISAKFQVNDTFPELYNVGMAIIGKGYAVFFILLDNVLTVQVADAQGALKKQGATQVSAIKKEFTLRVLQTDNACQIYYDQYLLTEIGACLSGADHVGTFSIKNGTPEETLLDFSTKL